MTITKLETITLDNASPLPGLVFVNVYTADGLVGHGESYYIPSAIESYIHDFAAEMLLGEDETRIAGIWNRQYELVARFGGRGAEMRAISAIDLALWDLAGKRCSVPIYQLLGGAVCSSIPVYNTCAGPTYGSSQRPAHGRAGDRNGRFEDLIAARERPAELAEELLDAGYTGMKIWPFDEIAQVSGGTRITNDALEQGLWAVDQIRSRVGHQLSIMIEGHGYWSLQPAVSIARALEPYEPAWIEDLMLADQPRALRRLRESTTIPVSVSEYLMTRWDYLPILEEDAADVIMIDPTWAGGISESRSIASLADAYRLPVTMHDCTGPFTLLAGMHVAASSPNAVWQEVVRSFIVRVYPELVDWMPTIKDGSLFPSEDPGLGANLHVEIGARSGTSTRISTLK